uniref:Uncharacterized protein n=1 Tax=Chromera velia CCMP2878 TaxID=1169474 RepID=A0A0G4HA65_9ALVE|eukprot:Cvel_25444.t1-p1 / transcript=Cvel_25444.t1 / gene=Cvel_25444 / organism=Chromera_velia_CCMP2878 / gene_product=Collagen alpha-1(V) chain, putative / transcript_product=Collagen alpha-1(V) chain, putative / location=Cvel_scaffold2883:3924-5458(+) / protein_length=414 / sequence_SO=supercontig / SO=protein_coding / is_pseudo=false
MRSIEKGRIERRLCGKRLDARKRERLLSRGGSGRAGGALSPSERREGVGGDGGGGAHLAGRQLGGKSGKALKRRERKRWGRGLGGDSEKMEKAAGRKRHQGPEESEEEQSCGQESRSERGNEDSVGATQQSEKRSFKDEPEGDDDPSGQLEASSGGYGDEGVVRLVTGVGPLMLLVPSTGMPALLMFPAVSLRFLLPTSRLRVFFPMATPGTVPLFLSVVSSPCIPVAAPGATLLFLQTAAIGLLVPMATPGAVPLFLSVVSSPCIPVAAPGKTLLFLHTAAISLLVPIATPGAVPLFLSIVSSPCIPVAAPGATVLFLQTAAISLLVPMATPGVVPLFLSVMSSHFIPVAAPGATLFFLQTAAIGLLVPMATPRAVPLFLSVMSSPCIPVTAAGVTPLSPLAMRRLSILEALG